MVQVREGNFKIFVTILFFLEYFCFSSALKHLLQEDDPRPLCSCSTIGKSLSTRVVGGHAAGRGHFPFATAIVPNYSQFRYSLATVNVNVKPYCGATLITDRHVITAAHCIKKRKSTDILLDIGEYNITHNRNKKNIRNAVTLLKHPEYRKKSFNNDIGVITVDHPIQFNENLRTAWLPSPNVEIPIGTTVSVYGWGRLEYSGDNPDALNTVDLPIVSRKECQMVYVSNITENMICAGGKEHEDACIGDSGSGLARRLENDYALVGVVSFGKRCGLKYVPGIYTKVSNYVQWIYNETKDASCQPCIVSPDN